MNGENFFLQDGMRGLSILKRPAEIQQIKNSRVLPFVSRVTSKEAVGLPPIMNTVVCSQNKDKKNYDSTKMLLKQLHKYPRKGEKKRKIKLCKLLKEDDRTKKALIEEPKNQDIQNKTETLHEKSDSKEKFEEQLEGQWSPLSEEIKIDSNDNQLINQNLKDNLKQPSLSLVEKLKKEVKNQNFLQEDNDDEVNKMLDFVNNLDYDKYKNDLEVRENLYVIKNQIDNETYIPPTQTEVLPEIIEEINSKAEEKISVTENFDKVTLIHEKDWDNSVYFYN
jgi:hypothetical protein